MICFATSSLASWLILVVMGILLLGNAGEPEKGGALQHATAELETQDYNILHDSYSSAGGPQITTDAWHWGYCKVWVKTTATKSFSEGNARNNPDGSFYPGDGFGYSFALGWLGDPLKCRNFTVCPIKSSGISPGIEQSCELSRLDVVERTASYDGSFSSLSGTAEISSDGERSGHYIQLQVNAERWGCHYPKKAPRSCGWAVISTTGVISPNVIKPHVGIALYHEHLNDSDGYKSANADGTYYLWDAINIIHNPTYEWKEERVGTLSVRITKTHDLNLEEEFQCLLPKCIFTLVHRGFEPWEGEFEYGSGLSLYNATKPDEIKKHPIKYKIELFNLGKLIHITENQTFSLVVNYEPVFQRYPYLVLGDEQWWSWSNRHAVALEYLGSVGGTQDDTPGIHHNRRSKVNQFVHDGFAFDPILRNALNETLSWSRIGNFADNPTYKCNERYLNYTMEEKKEGTAMFVQSGFGKIGFSFPILKTMLEKRYINATVNTTLQSAGFAGFATKNITNYLYQYPDVKFNNPIKILTYNSDGTRTDYPVAVSITPDFERGAAYLHEYVCKKVLHDTKSPEIAQIVVSDMYDTKNLANGTGYINLKTHLTSVWFPAFYSVLINDTLDLPIDRGYRTPSPYLIVLDVNGKTRSMNRIINFQSPFVHVVNLDQDNLLNVTERAGYVWINPDEKFGEITKLVINGRQVQKECTNGCSTTVLSGAQHIEAWNQWGGKAQGRILKTDPAQSDEIRWNIVLTALAISLAGFLVWRIYEWAIEYLGVRRL